MNLANFEANSSYYTCNSNRCKYEYWESIPCDAYLQSPIEVQASFCSFMHFEDSCKGDEDAKEQNRLQIGRHSTQLHPVSFYQIEQKHKFVSYSGEVINFFLLHKNVVSKRM